MHANPTRVADLNSGVVSFVSDLECSGCGEKYSCDEIHTFCPNCQSPLLVRYDLEAVHKHVDRDAFLCRQGSMWRWHELLPVKDPGNFVFLGEGDTPLLHLPNLGKEFGYPHLFVKDESLNPTGSFKSAGTCGGGLQSERIGHQKSDHSYGGECWRGHGGLRRACGNSGSDLHAQRYAALQH